QRREAHGARAHAVLSEGAWRLAAWLLLAAVALMTLAPLGWRPASGYPAGLERFAAFALIGLVFSLAYRRQYVLVALLVLAAAVGLEALQTIVQGRHAGLADAAAKLGGGACGLLAGRLAAVFRDRTRRR